MTFLTRPKAVRAWTISSVQAAAGKSLTIGALRHAYEQDVNLRCFTDDEKDEIRKHFHQTCQNVFGAELTPNCAGVTDQIEISGIEIRPIHKTAGKRVLVVESSTTINVNSGFNKKGGLATTGVANCGTACVFSCAYCSSGNVMERNPQTEILRVLGVDHGDVVIRRLDAVETARQQLTLPDGRPRYADPGDNRILEIASLVDPLATTDIMDETFELAKLVFRLTNWRVRILTKSALLQKFAHKFTGQERSRLLLGFSIGIPEDDVARVVEKGTTLPSTRFRIHRELLDEGFTMFGMSCPVLAVPDYRKLAEQIAAQIQPTRLERVWVEVINRRGGSLLKTVAALHAAGQTEAAKRLARVSSSEILWEMEYNRAAFLGFREVIPPEKLAFLTYVTPSSETWWAQYAKDGAILL